MKQEEKMPAPKERRNYGSNYAILTEKMSGIEKNYKSHEEQDEKRFNHTFAYIKEGFDKIDKNFDKMANRFDSLDTKVDSLWDDKNKREGAEQNRNQVFDFGKYIAGVIGGVIVAAFEYFKH